MFQKILCQVFSVVYRKWLWNDFYGTRDVVLKVIDWRTALVASVTLSGNLIGKRYTQSCFWIFK